jgi:hypothetical protein
MANQPLGISSAKGSTPTQEKYPLEQRSLPGPVSSPDEVATGMQGDFSLLDAAQIAKGEIAEDHAAIVTLGGRGLTCKASVGRQGYFDPIAEERAT